MKTVTTILLTLLLSTSLFGADKKSKAGDEIDYISLATILMKDAHYARAKEALTHVNLDPKNKELDRGQYYTLEGLIELKLKHYELSNKNFSLALENGKEDKHLYLYMAQNSFKLKAYEETLTALANAKELVDAKPQLLALKAESLYRLKRYNDALETLAFVNKRHPEYYDAYKQRFAYFVKLKLYQSALSDANIYLTHAKANEQVTLSFINALREAGQQKKAIQLAEIAHLQYPLSATITVMLANLYIDRDMIQSAAELFDTASLQDEKYIKDSSEMFRRAKDFVRALYKNSQILDTKEKYKQKIAIYLEFGDYERVVATRSALERSGLIKEQNMLYALAYAYYKVGNFNESETLLKKITQNDLFQKTITLRKNMNKCKNNHWECTL